jgi:hypothetical protein
MPRTSLQDVRSVGDPLLSFNWDFLIPRFPGVNDSRKFTFKCQTAVLPGMLLEQVPVRLHGVELRYAGAKNFSHSFPLTLLETSDVNSRDMFVRWTELARSWVLNTGSPADIYKTNAQLVIYDDTPKVTRTINIFGLWPENVDDAQLDGQQSAAVTYNITFSYDYHTDLLS